LHLFDLIEGSGEQTCWRMAVEEPASCARLADDARIGGIEAKRRMTRKRLCFEWR